METTNENKKLLKTVHDFGHVQKVSGQDKINQILKQVYEPENRKEQPVRKRDERER